MYDFACTFDQEILYVWPRPWSMSTALFVFNRYLPFVDTFLSLSAKFTRISPEQCLMRNEIVAWLSVFGILLSEGKIGAGPRSIPIHGELLAILMLRTYAIWERNRSVLIFLCVLAVAVSVPTAVLVNMETRSLHCVSAFYPL
ncbi:hypothetical protein K438DRAFT_204765 [Mycena galopus ATCC 62051]|nr:hypothetical protein K438DRAFT_204765 [Mycena galopus ATCC 62051]